MEAFFWRRGAVLVLGLLFCSVGFAKQTSGPFNVTIEGFAKDIQQIKLKADYKVTKSTSYCRGIRMPALKGNWVCDVAGPGVNRCVRAYQCQLVRKDFNVSTETARIVAELKKLPKVKTKFSIDFQDQPQNKLKKTVVNKITNPNDLGDPSGLRLSQAEIEALRQNRIDQEKLQQAKEQVREQELAQQAQASRAKIQKQLIEKSGQEKAKKFKPIKETEGKLAKKAPQSDQEELEDLYSEIYVADKEAPNSDWKLEKSRTTDGDTFYYKLGEKKVSKDKVIGPLKLKSFTGSMIQSSDSDGNSLATFEVAWTPEYTFKGKWGARGLIGGHMFKTTNVVDANDQGESFLVFDLAALATYEMGRVYAEAGLGLQKWNDTAGEMYTALHLGLGYRFRNYQLVFVDRIFVNYTKIDNLTSNTDLRIGLGISF